MSEMVETDVLIVGAGPAGAICSLLLGDLGVRNLMINKYPATSPGPQGAHHQPAGDGDPARSGAGKCRNRVGHPAKHDGPCFATSMVGEEFGRIHSWSNHPTAKAVHDLASPCAMCDLPQLYFEPLVVAQCALRGSDVRFQTSTFGTNRMTTALPRCCATV